MYVKKLQYVEHLLLCKYICNIFPNSVEVFIYCSYYFYELLNKQRVKKLYILPC